MIDLCSIPLPSLVDPTAQLYVLPQQKYEMDEEMQDQYNDQSPAKSPSHVWSRNHELKAPHQVENEYDDHLVGNVQSVVHRVKERMVGCEETN